MKDKLYNYILNYKGDLNYEEMYNDYITKNKPNNSPEEYVIKKILNDEIEKIKSRNRLISMRKNKLENLKKLELPEQRSEAWYQMRKTKLTASSLASAIGHCHFQSRDELILDKIIEKPFEPNPITEWGVKYEDVAIKFYEELFNVNILEFGMIPHPEFEAFGASPDGICDETGSKEHIARMVEIKCPPKRKFTKSVPGHYLMQVQGQLEVCDLDECDFFQVKLEEYDNIDEYQKDIFIDENEGVLHGRTNINFPKGVVITLKTDDKLSYIYSKLNQTDNELNKWIEEHKIQHDNIFEIKWWKITRYECTLVQRDKKWWNEKLEKILDFYEELQFYKNTPDKINELKDKIKLNKKRKTNFNLELNNFMLISDEEDNTHE